MPQGNVKLKKGSKPTKKIQKKTYNKTILPKDITSKKAKQLEKVCLLFLFQF